MTLFLSPVSTVLPSHPITNNVFRLMSNNNSTALFLMVIAFPESTERYPIYLEFILDIHEIYFQGI